MREYVLKIHSKNSTEARGEASNEFRFEADDFVAAIAEARSFHDKTIEAADLAELFEVELRPIQTWKLGVAQGV